MIQVFPVRLIFFVQVDQSFHLHCSVIGISSNNTYHIHKLTPSPPCPPLQSPIPKALLFTISCHPGPPPYHLLFPRPSSFSISYPPDPLPLQSPIHQALLFTISFPPDPHLYSLPSTRPSSLQSPIHQTLLFTISYHPSLGNNEKDVEPFFPSTNKFINNFINCS